MEAADEVLAFGEIDARLAADRGVNLGQEGCGDLYVTDAPHEDGSDKAADVANDATAEGDQERAAVPTGAKHLAQDAIDALDGLMFFAGRKKEDSGRFCEGCKEGVAPESPDLRRGKDENTTRQVADCTLSAGSQRSDQSAAREYIVFSGRGFDPNGMHVHSILSEQARRNRRVGTGATKPVLNH